MLRYLFTGELKQRTLTPGWLCEDKRLHLVQDAGSAGAICVLGQGPAGHRSQMRRRCGFKANSSWPVLWTLVSPRVPALDMKK